MIDGDVFVAKLRDGAIIPSKREEDGGMDIYACIDDAVIIRPGSIALIPTGLISAFDKKWRIILKERGSTGTKGMAVRCGVIDSGYRGEWFVPINNTSDKTIVITNKPEDYEKIKQHWTIYDTQKAICQAKVEAVPVIVVHEISKEYVLSFSSQRGAGMMGSSNK